MTDEKLRVAIIGCGHLGQHYATAYQTFPDTEVVAIAEYDSDKRKVVGERFGVTYGSVCGRRVDAEADRARCCGGRDPDQVHEGRCNRVCRGGRQGRHNR